MLGRATRLRFGLAEDRFPLDPGGAQTFGRDGDDDNDDNDDDDDGQEYDDFLLLMFASILTVEFLNMQVEAVFLLFGTWGCTAWLGMSGFWGLELQRAGDGARELGVPVVGLGVR